VINNKQIKSTNRRKQNNEDSWARFVTRLMLFQCKVAWRFDSKLNIVLIFPLLLQTLRNTIVWTPNLRYKNMGVVGILHRSASIQRGDWPPRRTNTPQKTAHCTINNNFGQLNIMVKICLLCYLP